MARIDFYVLSQSGAHARHAFACRLAEKAYRLDNTVHIHAGDNGTVRIIDELLWTFRDGSFVPHHCVGDDGLDSPVTIGCNPGSPARDLLINLSDELPEFFDHFDRVAELVTNDEDVKIRSRERFLHYREQGHTLETHKL
ncbi:MAG: DNA polymerase III subunit chi [Woeseiaceae bacterium]|nr:DNA polymerase III subunit chi [Woeseiaceae bacterium]